MSELNNMEKRIMVCLCSVPNKSRGASVILFYQYISALIKSKYKIMQVLFLDAKQANDDNLKEYLAQTKEYSNIVTNVFYCDEMVNFKKSAFVLEAFEPNTEAVRLCNDFKPEVIFCFDIVSAAISLPIKSAKRIVWLGDLNFDTIYYHALYSMKETKSVGNAISILKAQYLRKLWKKFYVKTLNNFDSIIVSSKSSEAKLEVLGLKSKYLPYPWPVEFFEKQPEVKKLEIPTFVFMGQLAGLGSRSSLHYLFDLIYPRLLRLWGSEGFQIFICGSHKLPKWVIEKLAIEKEIKYLGFVDDLSEIIDKSHAVIVPIDVPVGNRSRIITAMGLKALVIAHSSTTFGNPSLVNGNNCYLADNPGEFVDYMKMAFELPEKSKMIAENARIIYLETFEPESANTLMVAEIEKLFS